MTAALGDRPRPVPSSLTEEFWEAARREVLVRPVCRECGTNFFTPQIACPNCLSTDWAYEPSSGLGVVYSASIVHRPPFPGVEVPFEIATVDLDEGWSMLTNLLDPCPEPTAIGTPVEVAWVPLDDRITLPAFRRRETGGEGSA